MELKNYIVITDIGSTTTKAVLLRKKDEFFELLDYETYPTTVEKPFEDVKIGVYESIKKLENKLNVSILEQNCSPHNLCFNSDYDYLTTSSAGGGLQILVIGLTKNDSAYSAERAAFGVGGVLLDTLAIDDKRSANEQMRLLSHLHPDIILFCGGINGGAMFGVIRLAEILKLSNPSSKFSINAKIPLVYAGNIDAQPFIISLFQNKFDLYIVDNLRPTMKEENLKPASDMIHKLFMENVMEQAPGYHELKSFVSDDIIPTPTGVLLALKLLSESQNKNIIAFDIGGATTDFFSNIMGKYYRTVSANYGMSYSIANVMADSGFDTIWNYLKYIFPDNSDSKNYIKDYIANKMLNPEHIPIDEYQSVIELITAIQAILLSKKQHFNMNFNIKRIGFLDKIKNIDRDPFYDTMYCDKVISKYAFKINDLDIMIGAGGILSHTTKEQAIIIMLESLSPEGITEIWRDKHFITPHIGKLTTVDKNSAMNLLNNNCFEKLATVIRPNCKTFRKDKKLLSVSIEIDDQKEMFEIWGDDLFYYPDDSYKSVTISFFKNCSLNEFKETFVFKTSNAIIIDTRNRNKTSFSKILEVFKPYHFISDRNELQYSFKNNQKESLTLTDLHENNISLPYPGDIFVKEYENISPDTIIAENKFEPPKLFVVNVISNLNLILSPEIIEAGFLVKIGDTITAQQKIFTIKSDIAFIGFSTEFYCPVRGIVEKINYETGIVILREIQDYALKPKIINIANKLKIKPRHIKGYLTKRIGDFVYLGNALTILSHDKMKIVHSEYTGILTDIDTKKGTVTIFYDKKPSQLKSNCYGTVKSVKDNKDICLNIDAKMINGKIGFGKDNGGYLKIYSKNINIEEFGQAILLYPFTLDSNSLKKICDSNIKGVICPSIHYQDISQFINKEIGVALTGEENIPFPIIITEGFGQIPFKNDIFQLLKNYEDNFITLKTQTQIRAGVKRPEIIIYNIKQNL